MKKVEAAIARGGWHAFRTVKGQRGYALYEAPENYGPAKWPPEGASFLLRMAFEGRTIDRPDHPLLQSLRGIPVL